MPLIKDITNAIEAFAPLSLQEDYDNAGLITGDSNTECSGVLFSLDCTEAVIHEAIQKKCNLVIAHHPIIFRGLKKLSGGTYVERTIISSIKNDVAIYACHTNIDNVIDGVNAKIAQKLGLKNLKILSPKPELIKKLVVFVPVSHTKEVREAMFAAGGGHIGNYSNCSFNTEGTGTFKGNENTDPFIGEPNKLEQTREVRIETVFEAQNQKQVVAAMVKAHPYEEVAYDIYPLHNAHPKIGSGIIGELEKELSEKDFMALVKKTFNLSILRHTHLTNKNIKNVALCGGSGQFLLKNAINSKADSYITADFKYHEFFDADRKILLLDIGHFESEQFTPEIFYEIITEKFPKFAIHLSKTHTNPVNYF
jgi:dinuclear metal center YbgI/SA1388 family protein